MPRYDRSRFIAFGVLPAVNAAGLLLYGLGLATHVTGGAEQSLPALIVIAGVCLLTALAAIIRRGRDVGWPGWLTVLVFWVSLALGPVVLALIGYLAFAQSAATADKFGEPATPATLATWIWAFMNLLWPWAALAILSRVL